NAETPTRALRSPSRIRMFLSLVFALCLRTLPHCPAGRTVRSTPRALHGFPAQSGGATPFQRLPRPARNSFGVRAGSCTGISMADIFISYCRDDRPKAEQFHRALADEGLDVWWDAGLQAGEIFDEKVQQLLHSVKAVVVLWTPA